MRSYLSARAPRHKRQANPRKHRPGRAAKTAATDLDRPGDFRVEGDGNWDDDHTISIEGRVRDDAPLLLLPVHQSPAKFALPLAFPSHTLHTQRK